MVAFTRPRAVSGTMATRRSPARVSFGTPTFIRPAIPGARPRGRDLARELRKIEINPFAGEAPVPDRKEDDDAIAELMPARLDAEEWALHAAEDLRLFDDAVVRVDAVEQGQLHVRDRAPEAAVKLSNLVFTPPAPSERDDLVLAILVQGRDQALEFTAVFGARVLDPESIVGLREGTLGPGFEGAALQSGLRHI